MQVNKNFGNLLLLYAQMFLDTQPEAQVKVGIYVLSDSTTFKGKYGSFVEIDSRRLIVEKSSKHSFNHDKNLFLGMLIRKEISMPLRLFCQLATMALLSAC